jgi:hypothetical protein
MFARWFMPKMNSISVFVIVLKPLEKLSNFVYLVIYCVKYFFKKLNQFIKP